jgi:hypothetical protein
MKAPSSKDQAPEKLQGPSSKLQILKLVPKPLGFGVWDLGFLWKFELGAWCFF